MQVVFKVEGDGFRAARTRRALLAMGVPEGREGEVTRPWLVIRAGAVPASARALRSLLARVVAHPGPFLLFGAALAECADGAWKKSPEWAAFLGEWGGDCVSARAVGECVPASPCVLLDGASASEYSARRADGASSDAVLDLLASRVPHWHAAPLDSLEDGRCRVLQVVAGLQVGGAERVALSLHAHSPRVGVASRFAVIGRTVRTAYDAPPGVMFLSSCGDRMAQAREVGAVAARLGMDVVQAHLLTGDELRCVAASGVPVASSLHNTSDGWPPGLVEAADSVALWLACSKAVAVEFRDRIDSGEVRVVWNGVPDAVGASASRGREERRRLCVAPDAVVVLAVANFRPQKRLELLPGACAELRASLRAAGDSREVVLLVAGEASGGDAGVESVRAFDLAAVSGGVRCERLGAVGDLGALYDAADVFVSVSEREGLSLAQLEALAGGLPVVATAVGGAPEVASLTPGLTLVAPCALSGEVAGAMRSALSPSRGYESLLPVDFTREAMVRRNAYFLERLAEWESCRGALRRGVVFVTNNLSPGGAQSGARRLIMEMVGRGIPCRVRLLQERQEHPTPGTLALRAAGVEVETLDGPFSLAPFFEDCEARPPHAVLLWNAIPESKVMIAEGLSGVRVFDASPGEMYYASLRRYLARPRPGCPVRSLSDYARLLTGVIVKYEGEVDAARTLLGVVPNIVFNGVVLPEVCADPSSGGSLPLVGTLARISPQKKLEQLLASFELAHSRGCVGGLVIAGGVEPDCDGYAARLRTDFAHLPVEWVGHTEDIGSVLRRVGIFAMVSEPAGCPNASLEAMAHGLPVVATDVGAVSEQVVTGETGYVTARGDTHAMADAMAGLGASPALRVAFGAAGRARAERLFSVARMADGYARVLFSGN